MGLGQDKISAEVFNIEPTALLDLFVIYPDVVNFPNRAFYIHNGSVFGIGITWQGKDYKPVAMEYEGFEVTADGRQNRPLVRISNAEYFASSLLDQYQDFTNGRLIRKRTFVKFLDDENFDGGNPWGESDPGAQVSENEYIISQKKRENKEFVEIELTNPLDLETFEVNHRRVLAKYCYWKYRGSGCQYEGPPVERDNKQPFTDQNNNKTNSWYKAKKSRTSHLGGDFQFAEAADVYRDDKSYWEGNIVYKINDRVRIQDQKDPNFFRPLLTYYVAKQYSKGKDPNLHPDYWDKDGCSKTLDSCKNHFSNFGEVERKISSIIYNAEGFRTRPASHGHMGFLKPSAGLEGMFNWSTGSGYKDGRNKEITMAFHFDRTWPFQNINAFKETPDYNNLFNTDARSTNDGFRISFFQKYGYGEPVLNCKQRISSTSSAPVEFWLLRTGGVLSGSPLVAAEDIDLLSCEDLLIIIKMYKTNENSYEKSFDIEVSGVNTGRASGGRGDRKTFKITNTFNTGKVLKANSRALTFLGGPTRRDGATSGSPPGFPRNWAHNESVLSTAIIWNKKISNSVLKEVLGKKVNDDQEKPTIIRRFEDITTKDAKRKAVLQNAKAFWSGRTRKAGAFGLKDNIEGRDLLFKYSQQDKTALAGAGFFQYTNWPAQQVLLPNYLSVSKAYKATPNVSLEIDSFLSVEEDLGVLPFGGFPGTDGYNFRSAP